jgi:hypothetical protein
LEIRNTGGQNVYVGRAYLTPSYGFWGFFGLRRNSKVRISRHADRLSGRRYELKFSHGNNSNIYSDYETVVRPGFANRVTTWLPLDEVPSQDVIDELRSGTVYLEYARTDRMGVHKVRL